MTVNELIKALETMRAMGLGDADVTTEGCYTSGPEILTLEWGDDGITLLTTVEKHETKADREAKLAPLYERGLLVRR